MKALRSALPPGTLAVAVGIVILGAASYVYLAVAGHALSTDAMAHVSVMWTIVMSVGVGIFLPVEQEVTRIVAARATRGEGVAPVLLRSSILAGGMLVLALGLIAALAKPIANRLFDGDGRLVWALAGAFVGLAVCYATRGVLAGLGLFRAYSTQLALDGGLRIVMALALGLAGVKSPLAFGLVLMVAPVVATLATLRPVLRGARPGPQIAWTDLSRGLSLLVCSTLLSQLVVNVAVISTKLLAPDDKPLVTALLSAIVLARVPLFIFASLQTSLLKGLADALAAGDRPGFRQMLVRAVGAVTALGLLGGVPATLLGPWIIRVMFNSPNVLGASDFALLSAGTLLFMLAMVLGQAVMTMNHHAVQLLAWVAGTAVLAGVTSLPGDVALRVESAYALGSLTVVLVLVAALARFVRRIPEPASAPALTSLSPSPSLR